MEKDSVYIFDKVTFKRTYLGEIQSEYNMCQTIDGTKDSVDFIVVNFSDIEIEPYTICWHAFTNTWWVVSHDKIERRMNENGFIYFHNLELLGAIELLNARDLTDCAFNDNFYTQHEFIERLFSLSTFEYDWDFSELPNGFYNKVDFIKTFENYTLLSALREFLDSYNMCAKMTFTTTTSGNDTYIDEMRLHILYKSGNAQLDSHEIDDFSDVKENKTMDKNSFGTCVISNANNVVSSQAKTYPSTGFMQFSANEYEIKPENALLRLPNNVFQLNWLKMVVPSISITFMLDESSWNKQVIQNLAYEDDENSIKKIRDFINSFVAYGQVFPITQTNKNFLLNNVELIWQRAKELHSVTFYNGVEYNPNNTFTKPDNVSYIPVLERTNGTDDIQIIICPKDVKNNMRYPKQGIAWERGNNTITGFEYLDTHKHVQFKYTDGNYFVDALGLPTVLEQTTTEILDPQKISVYGSVVESSSDTFLAISISNTKYIVNYVPMADLKIKVDNVRDKRDTQLYNQNGKVTDSFALSKLLNSYSKEISSDNIVRYGQYYDFISVPKVGSYVLTNNGYYVINNVSMTFYQNEIDEQDKFGMFIDCEFNMSKWVSTKSLMVNPNTNIRDYGIPQNYNVKRKQLYRDYYELAYGIYDDSNQGTPYLSLNKLLPFGQEYQKTNDYTALIKLYYDQPIGTPPWHSWYYQLDCTTFILQKQMVLLCDFLDNNIIGYCQNNRNFIFDVANLFNQNSLINTPISYVDDIGRFKDITLLFINQENRSALDEEYYIDKGISPTFDALITQVFIPEELYEIAYQEEYYDFEIYEDDYNKDALEVPVFEYCCQVDDSEDVLIGDNILQQYDNLLYFYSLVEGDDGEIMNTNVWTPHNVAFLELNPYAELDNAIKIEYHDSETIYITYYQKVRYHTDTGEWEYISQKNIPIGVDLAIFRHACDRNDYYNSDIEQIKELMLICRKVPSANVIDNGKTLVLKINHYKLR